MKLKFFSITCLSFITMVLVFFSVATVNEYPLEVSKIYAVLGLCFLLILANVFLKAYRTKYFISFYTNASLGNQLAGISLGYFFDFLMPLRTGQLIRAWFLSKTEKISLGFILIALLFEKTFDMVFMFITLTLIGFLRGFDLFRSGIYVLLLSATFFVLFTISIFLAISQKPIFLKIVYVSSNLLNEKLAIQFRHSAWSAFFALQKMLRNRIFLYKYLILAFMSWGTYLTGLYLIMKVVPKKTFSMYSFTNTVLENGIGLASSHSFFGVVRGIFFSGFGSVHWKPHPQEFDFLAWLLSYPVLIILGYVCAIVFIYRFQRIQIVKKKYILDSYDDDSYHDRMIFVRNFFANNMIYADIHRELHLNEFTVLKYFNGGSDAITLLIKRGNSLFVRKCVSNKLTYKLQNQYQWLSGITSPHFVKCNDQGFALNHYFYDMEYLANFERFFAFIHRHELGASQNLLEQVFQIMQDEIYEVKDLKNQKENFLLFIDETFFSRVQNAVLQDERIMAIMGAPFVVINGKTFKNADSLVREILANEGLLDNLSLLSESPNIHGDLTIDNILISPEGELVIIDPSDDNKFSGPIIDVARMHQSLKCGYEFLSQPEYPVKYDVVEGIPVISFTHFKSVQYESLTKYFNDKIVPKILSPEEIRNIDFHVAILFFRMIPHQLRNAPELALKFLSVGIMLINEYWENQQLC